MLQYVQVVWGRKWPIFFFFFFTHAQCINTMYVLDSTRQESDVWIGVAFLSDNATRPVERAAEMRSRFRRGIFNELNFDTAEMRRMNRAYVLRIFGNANDSSCIKVIWAIVKFESKCLFFSTRFFRRRCSSYLLRSWLVYDTYRSVTVLRPCLFLTDRKFGGEKNSKGFHVLPPYLRIIQVSKENYLIFHAGISSLRAQL